MLGFYLVGTIHKYRKKLEQLFDSFFSDFYYALKAVVSATNTLNPRNATYFALHKNRLDIEQTINVVSVSFWVLHPILSQMSSFSGLRWDGKWREFDGMDLNAQDQEFPGFSWKKIEYPKNETRNADLYVQRLMFVSVHFRSCSNVMVCRCKHFSVMF